MSKAKTDNHGFTMIEVLLVSTLLSLLLMSFYTVLEMGYVIFRTDNIYSQLNHDAMQSLRFIGREIGQTSPVASPSHLNITTDANNNSVVRFQVPVDWDNDGDVVQNNTSDVTEWGAYDDVGLFSSGRLGGWVRYSVTNNQLNREVLDNTLNPMANLNRVVANNVQNFTVTQSQNILDMNLTLQRTDTIGQQGRSRIIQANFENQVMLRNAVD